MSEELLDKDGNEISRDAIEACIQAGRDAANAMRGGSLQQRGQADMANLIGDEVRESCTLNLVSGGSVRANGGGVLGK